MYSMRANQADGDQSLKVHKDMLEKTFDKIYVCFTSKLLLKISSHHLSTVLN